MTKQHDFFTSMSHDNLVELMVAKYDEVERLKAEIVRLNNKPSRIEQVSKDATKNHKRLMKYLLRIGRL